MSPIMSLAQSMNLNWLTGFQEYCRVLQRPSGAPSRENAREKAWLLLNSAFSQYLRFHSSRMGSVSREDLEDIAADKSLDLIRRIELLAWEPTERSPSEITGYLSKVARNGLVDRLRELGRWVEVATEDQPEWDPDLTVLEASYDPRIPPDSPSSRLERKEFTDALRGCAEELEPRSRIIWFLRVLCQHSSKEIATHPQVSIRASHVDVILHRARQALQECMRGKGCEPSDMPAGTFVELWESCRLDDALATSRVRK